VTVRRLNRYEVIQIRRLSGIENFVSERDDFIFNLFRHFKPVKSRVVGLDSWTWTRVGLESGFLRTWTWIWTRKLRSWTWT